MPHNQSLQRTRPSRSGCKRGRSQAGSLSLGRSACYANREKRPKEQTMKVPILAVSALCLVVSATALALTIEQKITPEYVRSHPNEFSVNVTEDKNGLLAFTVVLTLK